MKNLKLILGVLLISFSVFAQEGKNVKQSDLMGPAYKNYKHWMHQTEPIKIYSQKSGESLQGPAYKNQTWKNTPKEDLVLVSTGGDERQKLTGPAYKNHGPWSQKVK